MFLVSVDCRGFGFRVAIVGYLIIICNEKIQSSCSIHHFIHQTRHKSRVTCLRDLHLTDRYSEVFMMP